MSEKAIPRTAHHEVGLSVWPFIVGMSGLTVMFGFMAAFQWRLPLIGLILGGAGVVGVLIGLFGWLSEVYSQRFETRFKQDRCDYLYPL